MFVEIIIITRHLINGKVLRGAMAGMEVLFVFAVQQWRSFQVNHTRFSHRRCDAALPATERGKRRF
jgi:hypothetical protein